VDTPQASGAYHDSVETQTNWRWCWLRHVMAWQLLLNLPQRHRCFVSKQGRKTVYQYLISSLQCKPCRIALLLLSLLGVDDAN
jgi:hypothetical protein